MPSLVNTNSLDLKVANPASRPDVSVCIANYNGDPYVLECLESVFTQAGTFSLEVLVHDDCSTDGSLEIIRKGYPSVIAMESQANTGFCVSNNRMVAASSGRYVLLLNNDAVLRPGSLQRLFEFAQNGHQSDILGLPQYTLVDGSLMDRGFRTDILMNPVPVLTSTTHEVAVATGACLWVPRSVWDAVGGFPQWFESIAEDIYLCWAARLLGHRTVVLDTPGFDHWVGKNLGGGKVIANRMSTTIRRRALSERNKTFVMLLCYPASILLLVLPLHAVLLTVEALFLLVTGTSPQAIRRIYVPIPGAVWHQRKHLLSLRRHLLLQRKSSLRHLFAQTSWGSRKLGMLLRHGRPKLS